MKKIVCSILLAGWIFLILFLSFQNGQETAGTSFEFTKRILQIFIRQKPDDNFLMLWDGYFRLTAHFGLFFLYGIIGMLVITEFRKNPTFVQEAVLVSGILLAIISEVGKLPIPGRHLDLFEMVLNIFGVVMGVLTTMGFGWIGRKIILLFRREKD